MTTYNTGNTVPSADARDRYDNSQTFDEVINGTLTYYANRIGNNILSLKGMADLFNASQVDRAAAFQLFLEGTGWSSLGAYGAGVVITSHAQTVDYLGQPYSLKPSIPASLDAPYITTGVWATEGVNFKLVGDNSLRQDMADPVNNAEILAYSRKPIIAAIRFAHQMNDVQAVRVWEYANLITDKPDPADASTWDWYPAIQATINYAASLEDGWQVALPTLFIKCKSGLTIPFPKTALQGCLCAIDFSSMTSGYAMTFIRTEPNRPQVLYGGSQAEMAQFSIIGPGRDKAVDALKIGTTSPLSTATGQAPTFRGVYVQGFKDAIYGGSDAYLARFDDCEFYSNSNVLHLPAGEANYGENFSFSGGSMHGNRRVLTMEANNASVFMSQVSFDFNGKEASSQFYIRNSAIDLDSCHFEMGHVNTPVLAPPIDISGDQARFAMKGGFILAHPSSGSDVRFNTDYFALIGAGASVTFDGVRVVDLRPNLAFASGTGRLTTRDWEIGNTSNVLGWGKDQVLMDYGFEAATIQDMIYLKNGIGTALDWRTGENLALSNSAVDKFSGAQSLRVQKRIGASSTPTGATSFVLSIPARPGERYHYRLKCLDRAGRGGAVSVNLRWGNRLGFDKNGIPRTAMGASYSTYTFSPTSTWGTYYPLTNINGSDAAACPPNADTLFMEFNTNAFVGGEGAPEGGWYSLYFDELEIYRW